MKLTLGILGGMGPQATIDLQQKILNLTRVTKDQEHMRIFVDNHPQIPERISAITSGTTSPVEALMDSVRKLAGCGVECIAMPCVTAHYFLPQLEIPPHIKFLNILEIAAKACLEHHSGKTVGILCTAGTAKSGIVSGILDKNGIPYIKPLEEEQIILGELIMGVKAKTDMNEIVRKFGIITNEMSKRGAEYFLLACTEIPIIAQAYSFPHDFVDVTTELAKAAVTECGYECI